MSSRPHFHSVPLVGLGVTLCLVVFGALACAAEPRSTGPSAPALQESPSPAVPDQAVLPSTGDCSLDVRSTGSEGYLGEWELRTRQPCPGPEGIDILALGDVGYPGKRLQSSVAAMNTLCAQEGCDLVGIAGDLIYGPGDAAVEVWRGVWDEAIATLGLPGLTVLGNHEYRHEPNPHLKRKAVYAADKRNGLILPGPSYVARLRDGKTTLLTVAAIDSDSIANPGPKMPGGASETLAAACSEGAPVLVVGHHPPTSQGRHHGHEAHVESALRTLLRGAPEGCDLIAYLAGHDHDLQAYGPGCEESGTPAVIVSGVAARGFRGPGPQHLPQCASPDIPSTYHAGPSEDGGFVWLRIPLTGASPTQAGLYQVPGGAPARELTRIEW